MIPKIIVQTSKDPIKPQVVEKLKRYLGKDWQYYYFNDEKILEYFKNNPLVDFPNIIDVFNSFKGAHKSDLFRYYFLYINGGVYIDSDAMLLINIEKILKDYPCDFFVPITKHTQITFNGFLGCTKQNKIIYEALKDAYNTNPKDLANYYHLLCKNLTTIVKKYSNEINVHLFTELCDMPGISRTINGKVEILYHYYETNVPHIFRYEINK